MLWIETMSAEEELRAAVEGAATTGLPIVTTMSFDTNGRTMMGITPEAFGTLTAARAASRSPIGANCGVGASELVATILAMTAARPDADVVAKGNCGIPQYDDGHIHYTGTPELMADYAGSRSMPVHASSAAAAAPRPSISPPCAARARRPRAGDRARPSRRSSRARAGSCVGQGHDEAASAGKSGQRRRRRGDRARELSHRQTQSSRLWPSESAELVWLCRWFRGT